MKKQGCIALIVIVTLVMVIVKPLRAADDTGLSTGLLQELKASIPLDARTRALINAVTNSDIKELAFNRELFTKHNEVFPIKIETKGITNQAQSGRCWLFAGLNIMRPAVMKKYKLSEFEFSQNYLFFWDKLEKANLFLEAIIETRKNPIDDRELQILLEDPVPDGGWWSYVAAVIDKYGAAPREIMPDTKNAGNTGMMNQVLNTLMRRDAADLRKSAKEGKDVSALRSWKVEMLKEIFRILILHLGVPPETFTWHVEDKDGKIFSKEYTPVSFYKEVVNLDLKEYVSLFDHPIHPYHKYYRIRYSRNMKDLPDMDFINLEIDCLKEFALKTLLGGEPVWFAADIGKQNDNKNGILAEGIYDFESLYGIQTGMTKADGIGYRSTTPSHAMVFVGADTLGGKPVKWRVENSWGAEKGNKGYWTMTDDWFENYVFTVIMHKRYLTKDVLRLLETKPEILPVWDPMRAVFN